jgi:hypothetical protein
MLTALCCLYDQTSRVCVCVQTAQAHISMLLSVALPAVDGQLFAL